MPNQECSSHAFGLPAARSSTASRKKWVQGPHAHSLLSGPASFDHLRSVLTHVALYPVSQTHLFRRHNLSRRPCTENRQESDPIRLGQGKESRFPSPLGPLAPSVVPQAPVQRSVLCVLICMSPLSGNSTCFFPGTPLDPFSDRDSIHQICPISRRHIPATVIGSGRTCDSGWSRV